MPHCFSKQVLRVSFLWIYFCFFWEICFGEHNFQFYYYSNEQISWDFFCYFCWIFSPLNFFKSDDSVHLFTRKQLWSSLFVTKLQAATLLNTSSIADVKFRDFFSKGDNFSSWFLPSVKWRTLMAIGNTGQLIGLIQASLISFCSLPGVMW